MAALDFPDTPAVNDTYGSSGVKWKWDGSKWGLTWAPVTTPSSIMRGVQQLAMQIGADYNVASGAVVNMAYAPSMTFTAGRTYRLTGYIRAALTGPGVSSTSFRTYWNLAGTIFPAGNDGYSYISHQTVGQYSHIYQVFIYVCSTTQTVALTWSGVNAQGAQGIIRIWGDNSFCHVEDVTYAADVGPAGPQGIPGPTGPGGLGVPAGGTTGQILAKNSAADNDTSWQPPGATSNDSITNAHLANMAAHTFKGNNTAATADPKDLTITELQAELGIPVPVWTNAALASPWVYAGSARPQNGYAKSGNRVDVRVAATGGTPGSTIFTLPSTHWPGGTLDFIGRDSGGTGVIFNITGAGQVNWYGAAGNNTLCSCYMTYLTG